MEQQLTILAKQYWSTNKDLSLQLLKQFLLDSGFDKVKLSIDSGNDNENKVSITPSTMSPSVRSLQSKSWADIVDENSQELNEIKGQSWSRDDFIINFQCSSFDWLSDIRPSSRIRIKKDVELTVTCDWIRSDIPKVKLGVLEYNDDDENYKYFIIDLRERVICFKDELGHSTKMKIKLMMIEKPIYNPE
jgi:hypothetical protein